VNSKNIFKSVAVLCLLFFFLDFAFAAGEPETVAKAVMNPTEFIFNTIQFFCMALIVYFLMVINPTRAREEGHLKFIEELKKNDKVVTSSGLRGKVVSIKPEEINIEIANNVKVAVEPKHVHPQIEKSKLASKQAAK